MRKVPSFAVSRRVKPYGLASPPADRGVLPVGASCHVSIIASPTACPAPSSTRPASTTASPSSARTHLAPSFQRSASWKKGPIVCEGVRAAISDPQRRGLGARQHDVEPIAERDAFDARLEVERADHALARLLVRHALV